VSSEINFYLGEIEMDLKKPDSALAYYKEVSPDFAKYEMVISREVAVYRAAKDYALAEKTLRDAMGKRADLVGLYPMLGAIFEDQNKLALARDALEEGRKIFPKDESILYYLGFIYDRIGDKKNSFALMSKILETNPDNVNALNFVGYSLLEKGEDLAKAETYLKRAFELKPTDPFILDSYGWLLFREGKQKMAMFYLEKAYSLRPNEAVIAEHLADTYVALHLTQKALLVYQSALGVDSDEEGFKSRVQVKVQNLKSAMVDSEPGSRVPASDQ
jgi:tetratricopeptide (TPR) repeat protein